MFGTPSLDRTGPQSVHTNPMTTHTTKMAKWSFTPPLGVNTDTWSPIKSLRPTKRKSASMDGDEPESKSAATARADTVHAHAGILKTAPGRYCFVHPKTKTRTLWNTTNTLVIDACTNLVCLLVVFTAGYLYAVHSKQEHDHRDV